MGGLDRSVASCEESGRVPRGPSEIAAITTTTTAAIPPMSRRRVPITASAGDVLPGARVSAQAATGASCVSAVGETVEPLAGSINCLGAGVPALVGATDPVAARSAAANSAQLVNRSAGSSRGPAVEQGRQPRVLDVVQAVEEGRVEVGDQSRQRGLNAQRQDRRSADGMRSRPARTGQRARRWFHLAAMATIKTDSWLAPPPGFP